MPLTTLEIQQTQMRLNDLRRKLKRPIESVPEMQQVAAEIVEAMHHLLHAVDQLAKQRGRTPR